MTNLTTGRRRKRKQSFVMIENSMFEDNRLSWKAKGLLGYLLTKPDGWTVRISDLVKHATDGEKAIRSAIKELRECGYLTFHRFKKENGQWGGTVWEYDDIPVFDVEEDKQAEKQEEVPQGQEQQEVEPRACFGHVEKGHAEKGTYINNTNSTNTYFSNISSSSKIQNSIDSKLKEKYSAVPFEKVKEELLNDETATINTNKQYESMLEYRLKHWKPRSKKKERYKKPVRTEMLPEWFDSDENKFFDKIRHKNLAELMLMTTELTGHGQQLKWLWERIKVKEEYEKRILTVEEAKAEIQREKEKIAAYFQNS